MLKQEPTILYRDDEMLVIQKPSGLLVHSAPHMKIPHGPTLADWLREHFPQTMNVGDNPKYRPGIVHRLDKETSGVMLVALTQEAFLYFKKCFAQKEIQKTYKAIVIGELADITGSVDMPIGVKAGTTRRTTHGGKDIKEAHTLYEVDKVFKKDAETFSLLSVFPLTGRTHQIRVHLNSIHHPVAGDSMYGGKKNASLAPRLMLHAYAIEYTDRVGIARRFQAPLPQEFIDFIGSV